MLILSIDTSTTVCSVALHQINEDAAQNPEKARLLGCYELFTERTSSAMLTTLISDVVRHAGHDLNQLDAIAVAKGPGSYTGLRIGVSTAKGLCFALDKPLIAINTLEAMAAQVRPWITSTNADSTLPILCPMLDARRMEVYCALYGEANTVVMPTSAKIVDEQTFADVLDRGPVLFFGDGADKCRPVLSDHPNARFLAQLIQPSARTVGELAGVAFAERRFEDVASFEPFYLKDFMTTKPKKASV